MAKKQILEEIKQQVEAIVEEFNRKVIKIPAAYYVTQYKGEYVHLGRLRWEKFGPPCRLKYTGNMKAWGFAIYKYSDEAYDPEEWFFTGAEHVDGTVERALKAGWNAYPW